MGQILVSLRRATYPQHHVKVSVHSWGESKRLVPLFQVRLLESAASLRALSLLMLLQVLGLLLFAAYSVSQPTWTSFLDDFAALKIGAALADRIPLVSALPAKDVAPLGKNSGYIGDDGDDADSLRTVIVGGFGRPRKHIPYRCVNSETKSSYRGW